MSATLESDIRESARTQSLQVGGLGVATRAGKNGWRGIQPGGRRWGGTARGFAEPARPPQAHPKSDTPEPPETSRNPNQRLPK